MTRNIHQSSYFLGACVCLLKIYREISRGQIIWAQDQEQMKNTFLISN